MRIEITLRWLAWASLALLSGCVGRQPDQAILSPVGFQDLPGWQMDRVAEANPIGHARVPIRVPVRRAARNA